MVNFTFHGRANATAVESIAYYVSGMYVIRQFLECGFQISVAPFGQSDLADLNYLQDLEHHPTRWLCMHTPQGIRDFITSHPGGFIWTYSETTLLGGDVVPSFNKASHVFSLTTFGKFAMIGAGVEVPITVQPLGIDTTLYKPKKRETDYRLSFLAKGYIPRKNLDMAVRSYLEVFSEDDNCILYIHNFLPAEIGDASWLGELCRGRRDVKFINRLIPLSENIELYQLADYLIAPTSGEGFGLVILEAMACGCVPITTGFGGVLDFVSPQNSLIIRVADFLPMSIKQYPQHSGMDGFLAAPDEPYLCTLLERTNTIDRELLTGAALKTSALYDWKVCLSPLIGVIRSEWGI